jgi:hypothetical protein
MSTYQNKYLKYKNKYIKFKNQIAGMLSTPESLLSPSESLLSTPRFNYGSPMTPNESSNIKTRLNFGFDSPEKENILSEKENILSEKFDIIPKSNFGFDSPEKEINKKKQYVNSQEQIESSLSSKDNEIILLLNDYFSNNWVLTGSVAVKLYLIHLNLLDLINFTTSDIDALVIKEGKRKCDIEERKLGTYKRVQETPQRSVTFTNGEFSIDISCISKMPKINNINGINILSPSILLTYYLDDERDKDKPKIYALKEIIKYINENNISLKL